MDTKTCKDCSWYDLTEGSCYNTSVSLTGVLRESSTPACDRADIEEEEGSDTFYLVEQKPLTGTGKYWVKAGVSPHTLKESFVNFAGSYVPRHDGLFQIFEIVTADSWEDLDWTKTYLNRSENEAGWLDREGRFYSCPYEEHDHYAHFILKQSVGDLERQGWVRVSESRKYYYALCPMTPEQRTWLDSQGFDVEDDGHL